MLTANVDDGLMIITVSGKLTREDFASFAPEFEQVAREQARVPMLIDARALEGYEAGALWDDLRFDLAHRREFGPMAIIGDERWKEWGSKLFGLFFGAEIRHFGSGRIGEAKEWLRAQRASQD